MIMTAAERMECFGEGIFQLLNEKKLEVEKSGRETYNFSVGTPDFLTPKHIVEAVSEASLKPENYRYSLVDIAPLKEALIRRYKERYGVSICEEEFMSVYGSQEGIAHIGLALINPGDVVLVPDPGYPIFTVGPILAGADLRTYDLLPENDYLPDLDVLSREYGKNSKKHAKMMIVSYPLNPICKRCPDSFYEKLLVWAKENEILIIHDNAYSDIVYDGNEGKSILSFEGAKDVCVEFYSLSKSYNYTGARMGFLVGNKEVIAHFRHLRSQIDYGTFLPVQYGAVAALNGPDDFVKEQCRTYQERRDALCDGLTKLGMDFPRSEGTMFAWGKIPAKYGTDDVSFVMDLLKETGVICTPGSSFGQNGKGYVRFALVLPVEKINMALQRIQESNLLS